GLLRQEDHGVAGTDQRFGGAAVAQKLPGMVVETNVELFQSSGFDEAENPCRDALLAVPPTQAQRLAGGGEVRNLVRVDLEAVADLDDRQDVQAALPVPDAQKLTRPYFAIRLQVDGDLREAGTLVPVNDLADPPEGRRQRRLHVCGCVAHYQDGPRFLATVITGQALAVLPLFAFVRSLHWLLLCSGMFGKPL